MTCVGEPIVSSVEKAPRRTPTEATSRKARLAPILFGNDDDLYGHSSKHNTVKRDVFLVTIAEGSLRPRVPEEEDEEACQASPDAPWR